MCQRFGQRLVGARCFGFFLPFLAELQKILNVVPTADQYEVDCLEPFFPGWVDDSCIQIVDQFEYNLDAFVAKGCAAILDLAKLHIRQHDLQDAFKYMAAPIILFLDKLCNCGNAFILLFPQCFQAVAQRTAELRKEPVLNIGILDDIGNLVRDIPEHFHILRLLFCIFPQSPFIGGIHRQLVNRSRRIPLASTEIIVIGLARQKIRVQAVPQFMGKQTANDLVAVLAPSVLGHQLVACIDQDRQIVGAGHLAGLWTPADGYMDAAVVLIPRLCHGHVFKMTRKDTGCEELSVCDLAALLVEQLLDPFVTHSCHEELSSFPLILCRCAFPLRGEHRIQNRCNQRLPILFISGGLADHGILR